MQPDQLSKDFWQLIENRYPGTALWWNRDVSGSWWPEWDEAAFQREMQRWLALAAAAGSLPEGVEPHSWARYARLAAGRLRGEVWRRADAPLSHARHGLEALRIIGDDRRFFQALLDLPDWLHGISGIMAGDFWTTIELSREAHALIKGVCMTPAPTGMDSLRWAVAMDEVKSAIQAYVQTVKQHSYGTVTVVPWIASAHVDVMRWRRRRKQFDDQQGGPSFLHARGKDLVQRMPFHSQCHMKSLGWLTSRSYTRWLCTGPPTVYYGPTSSTTLVLNSILTEWKRRARHIDALTWAIAEPMWMEAGLWRAAKRLAEEPEYGFVELENVVAYWTRNQEAIALADAWLWLELGEPEQVARWLERFLCQRDAWSMVPYLKNNPGRALISLQNYERWDDYSERPWMGWDWGPIAPEVLGQGHGTTRVRPRRIEGDP